MSMFSKLFPRERAPARPDIPSGKFQPEVQAYITGGTPLVSGSPLLPLVGGFYEPPEIIARAIQVINARALQASYTADTAMVRSRLAGGYAHGYTRRQFYQAVYEGLLTHGNVLVWRSGRQLHFATSALSLVDGEWHYSEFVPAKNSFIQGSVSYEGATLIRWDMQQGNSVLGSSPARAATPAATAYHLAVSMLQSYAERGSKIEAVVKQVDNHGKPEDVAEYLKDITTQLRAPGTNRIVALQQGFEVVGINTSAPALRETIEESVTAVARIYGVPVAYLGITQKGVRQPPAEMSAHLVGDAVVPLLNTVADGLTRVLGGEVSVDTSAIIAATWEQRVNSVKVLAQVGTHRINELRALLGDAPIPEGDVIPAAAGAPEREDGGTADPDREVQTPAPEDDQ